MNSIIQLITVLFIFLFVLVITYFTTRWIANFLKGKITNQNIQVIETYRLTTNKYIQSVKIGEKYLAIGIGKDTVTPLTELTEEQLMIPDVAESTIPSFKEVWDKVKLQKPVK